MKKPFGLLAASLLLSGLAHADAPFDAHEMLRRFDACDGTFFAYLAQHRATLGALAPMRGGDRAAAFQVEDRQGEETAYVAFRRPIEVDGIRLLGYFDSEVDLQILGRYVSWGFVTDQTPAQLGRYAYRHLPQGRRLAYVAQDDSFVRVDRREQGGDWHAVADPAAESGKAVGLGAVERDQLIERVPATLKRMTGARAEITCSLQGAVDEALLRQSRPDLNK